MDADTHLLHFFKRIYDPAVGRWLTPDPAGYIDGPNLYAYVNNNPMKFCDPYGLSAEEHKEQSQGTFWGSLSWGAFNDTSYGLADKAFGPYVCDNWQSHLGYGIGTGTSLAAGLFYGGTEVKIARKVLGYTGKGIGRLGRMCNFTAKEVKAASKVEGTAAKISKEITPKIERSVKDVVQPKNMLNNTSKSGRNRFSPDIEAAGAHSVFRRDSTNGTAKYATYQPQTNLRNPNPWEMVKRFDGANHPHSHFNNHLKEWVDTPHVHDPLIPGGVRPPKNWEMP